jgi:hypothetical protein
MNQQFNVRRLLDGSVQFMGPAVFVAPPPVAMEIVRAILHELGCEVVFADPGQTVIRPPRGNGNGNGLIQ